MNLWSSYMIQPESARQGILLGISLSLSFFLCLSLSLPFMYLLTHTPNTHRGNPTRVAVAMRVLSQGFVDLRSQPSFTITVLWKWNLLLQNMFIVLITLIHYRTPINSDTFDCKWSCIYYDYIATFTWLYKNVTHFTIRTIRLFDFYLKKVINKVA